MEKNYRPLIIPGWSDSPTWNEGHINDYLPGKKYGNDGTSWDMALQNNDFISLYTVIDEKNEHYYKIVYTKEPDAPVYVKWVTQDQRFGYDILDRQAAELEVEKIQQRIDGLLN